ncbi:MAG: hypothetical protein CMK59_13670 [Proteobacteria bacterium]|nr:hypothetical protein [Pseudomonadota bacterium]
MDLKPILMCILVPFLLGWREGDDFVIQNWEEKDSVRIVLIGDTGQLPTEGDPFKMNKIQREQLRQSLREEQATAIVDLGDLFYWKSPRCSKVFNSEQELKDIDAHLYDYVGGLKTPLFLVLGNHDVGPFAEHYLRRLNGGDFGKSSSARERCYLQQPKIHDDVYFPSSVYGVDFGPVRMAVLHTSSPYRHWPSKDIGDFLDSADWSLLVGHHVYKTACDKEDEDIVLPWIESGGIRPNIYANGHAHILQLGHFEGTTAITSGAGSKIRVFPDCDPKKTKGVVWGLSEFGYATLDVDSEKIVVRYKNIVGDELFCWERRREDSFGAECIGS